MIWPFVSRALYDETKRELAVVVRQDNASWWALRDELTTERGRYDALMEKYHQLKLLGASIPEPAPAPAQKPAPDPVTQAIILKAGTSRQLRKHYADYVTEQRAVGVDDAEIAQAIIQGVTDDDGVPA